MPGELVIRTAGSSVNYKDALAGSGQGKILRQYPLVGGIDVAGHVMQSSDPRFKEGDAVRVKVLEVDRQGRVRLSIKDVEQG